jgi:hypothetical protein
VFWWGVVKAIAHGVGLLAGLIACMAGSSAGAQAFPVERWIASRLWNDRRALGALI